MNSQFDPYYQWLGIPPAEQPPNYYRLLGLRPFESDTATIISAADQRLNFLAGQAYNGEFAADASRLYQEIAFVRGYLGDPHQRAQYDAWLRQICGLPAAPPAGGYSAPPPVSTAPAYSQPTPQDTQPPPSPPPSASQQYAAVADPWQSTAPATGTTGGWGAPPSSGQTAGGYTTQGGTSAPNAYSAPGGYSTPGSGSGSPGGSTPPGYAQPYDPYGSDAPTPPPGSTVNGGLPNDVPQAQPWHASDETPKVASPAPVSLFTPPESKRQRKNQLPMVLGVTGGVIFGGLLLILLSNASAPTVAQQTSHTPAETTEERPQVPTESLADPTEPMPQRERPRPNFQPRQPEPMAEPRPEPQPEPEPAPQPEPETPAPQPEQPGMQAPGGEGPGMEAPAPTEGSEPDSEVNEIGAGRPEMPDPDAKPDGVDLAINGAPTPNPDMARPDAPDAPQPSGPAGSGDASKFGPLASEIREMMATRDMEGAARQLAEAKVHAVTEEQKEELDDLEKVLQPLTAFHTAVSEQCAALASGQELEINGNRVAVVEARRDHLVLRTAGANRRWDMKNLPSSICVYLARKYLDDRPANRLCFAAFYALDHLAKPEERNEVAGILFGLSSSGLDKPAQAIFNEMERSPR